MRSLDELANSLRQGGDPGQASVPKLPNVDESAGGWTHLGKRDTPDRKVVDFDFDKDGKLVPTTVREGKTVRELTAPERQAIKDNWKDLRAGKTSLTDVLDSVERAAKKKADDAVDRRLDERETPQTRRRREEDQTMAAMDDLWKRQTGIERPPTISVAPPPGAPNGMPRIVVKAGDSIRCEVKVIEGPTNTFTVSVNVQEPDQPSSQTPSPPGSGTTSIDGLTDLVVPVYHRASAIQPLSVALAVSTKYWVKIDEAYNSGAGRVTLETGAFGTPTDGVSICRILETDADGVITYYRQCWEDSGNLRAADITETTV